MPEESVARPPMHPLMRLCLDVEQSLRDAHRPPVQSMQESPMQHKPVASSFIESIAHDPDTAVLEVKLTNGQVYRHPDVSAEAHTAFMGEGVDDHSIGRHYNKVIKAQYPGQRVDAEPRG